jgi:hypothetical protein
MAAVLIGPHHQNNNNSNASVVGWAALAVFML